MSADILQFTRKVECVACGRTYRAAVRPTNHPLLKERRANICHECMSGTGGEVAALSKAIDDFLDPIKAEVARTGDAATYLNFLIELQRIGVPDD